ncbi:MAG TPA: hypothetical protein PLS03_09955 [Terrimicrobiaceae bacterium]|nr:hypothetical protein [Terrimicrobiaceae bacterium]
MNEITEERRAALARTIVPVSTEELAELGDRIFPNLDHPWRQIFLDFVAQHSGARFFHGTTHDGVHVLYCDSQEQGIWFVPDTGSGPLQDKGIAILREITASL